MQPIIIAEQLSRQPNLHEITLTVSAGEITGLVGSQGSGKSTLLSVLAGQVPPTGGAASVGGLPLGDRNLPRAFGAMGERWGFLPNLTARENLELFARLSGASSDAVDGALKFVDLAASARVRVGKLHPGEQARLGLARAALHNPPALLLDEPIGDVDRESASILQFAISDLAERGKAILVATYGHPKTLQICTRLLYLEDGRLIQPAPAGAAAASQAAEEEAPPIRHIAARRGERVLLFAPDEIRYAYAQDKGVYIQTADGPCAVTFTLTELEDRMGEYGFFRCHRGFLVNVSWVKEIATWTRDSYSLLLKDGKDVPLSKHRAAELRQRLGW